MWIWLANVNPVVSSAVAAIGLVGSILTFWRARWLQDRVDETSAKPTISDRIEQLRENLASSRELIDEVNAELEAQATNLEKIKAEAEQNQRLAALNKEAAETVSHLLEKVIDTAQRKASRRGTLQQWLFFLAGLLMSIPIGVFVNVFSR